VTDPLQPPAIMLALAKLEEWLARDGAARRLVTLEYVPSLKPPWRTVVALGPRFTEHAGRTMADALAQAAQVVVADPERLGAT
jgi:hypothetical protein